MGPPHQKKRVVGTSNIYQIRKEEGEGERIDHTPIGFGGLSPDC